MTDEKEIAVVVPQKGLMYLMLEDSAENWKFPSQEINGEEPPEKVAIEGLKEDTSLEGEVVERAQPFVSEDEGLKIYPFLVEVKGEVELSGKFSDYAWAQVPGLKTLDTARGLKSLEELGEIDD
ncbi:hypothetical protein GKQ38_01270 [Candidatus Nanohaloarchaea archaeon]|nr:hypothetical protein GKQ38_01270 [Candidatus Nanohaloarchaea archaeon]